MNRTNKKVYLSLILEFLVSYVSHKESRLNERISFKLIFLICL